MDYFRNDPVEIVHRCNSPRDIEVMGIVCSWLAFGNRLQIHKKCDFAFTLMDGRPYDYVMGQLWRVYEGSGENFYRMLFYRDFHDLMLSLYNIYKGYATMEDAVLSKGDVSDPVLLVDRVLSLFDCAGIPKNTASACKRVVMFLRWMVRRDDRVDFGIWRRINPRLLLIPLDVHVLNIAKSQGLITRKSADMKAALELATHARELFPDDPAIMDFALFTPDYEKKH
ncbi:MAG: TIGR02757 family protein [Paludibacteraceae bacterium]|nr:TIGR02757 family protein [Paludibacteraceae bacterium]